MHCDVNVLFAELWQDYIKMTPSAANIHQLLGDGADIINDHIALRTFNIASVNLAVLAKHFIAIGYVDCGDYHFEKKKLVAKHFEHPDPSQPKVFISELMVEEFSPQLQATVKGLVAQMDVSAVTADNFLYSGRHWDLDLATYQALLAESEYAAWVAALGYRANHFTVSINDLPDFDDIESVNLKLKEAGFILNSAGGEVKGSKAVLLEQSSTMADRMVVKFSDAELEIPSCFYEFAKRYPLENGKLYTGFVAASADKIFESTNAM
ncbi:DUF1338 domain-containing protein [Shewanella intestini]|uniref:2-oxoadipate dioxygenase/decarboxylase n=1 Tax=Shewanella intestini TaxID=2017544 RepID=A0ABS5I1B4_9GAMM|nr:MULTISPECIES: DUF1338 domain-containing protein [Shewanella]MBR9727701.1 DUF1338 family protein [Shewanella intestini]MRG35149.1 DUF1338 family protein [Shewanella sp. XMDDZSB0408]